MEWILFWAGVNAVIGYAIGKPKNIAGSAIMFSVLLGPIGWIIAMASTGDMRQCPFCAEMVKPEARVCKHCHRELPTAQAWTGKAAVEPQAPKWLIPAAVVLGVFAVAGALAWDYLGGRSADVSQSESHLPIAPKWFTEPKSLYARITKRTQAGQVILESGNVVLVTARSSDDRARVNIDGHEAEVPLGNLEIDPWKP